MAFFFFLLVFYALPFAENISSTIINIVWPNKTSKLLLLLLLHVHENSILKLNGRHCCSCMKFLWSHCSVADDQFNKLYLLLKRFLRFGRASVLVFVASVFETNGERITYGLFSCHFTFHHTN